MFPLVHNCYAKTGLFQKICGCKAGNGTSDHENIHFYPSL
jgi:hypothetical protein